VERKAHETDRRAHRIRLLPTGKRKFQQVRKLAAALQAEILSVLPEKDREPFLAQLAAVADACRNAADRADRES
jgi:DNA-binding MarR family transcriptional regulator